MATLSNKAAKSRAWVKARIAYGNILFSKLRNLLNTHEDIQRSLEFACIINKIDSVD